MVQPVRDLSDVRAVVFDFDLTLADSRLGFIASHDFASRRVGLPQPAHEAVEQTIGTPLHIAVPRLHGDAVLPVLDEYLRTYQARADEVMTSLTIMLPGAVDAVRRLHAAGIRLAIVSQKLRYRVEDVLRREHLLHLFVAVLGGEDLPDFKPDPRGLLLALEKLRTSPAASLYAGDTVIDAETSRRAGVRFVALLTGSTSGEALEEHRPVAVLPSAAALADLLGP
jgi:phosphoglycolate phosphatase